MIFCKFRKDVVIHNMLINSPIRFRKHTIYSILAAVVLFLVLAAGQKARADEIIAGLGASEKYKQVSAPFTISIRFGKKSENLTESMTADWRYSMGDTIYWRDEPIYEYFQTLKEKYDTPFGSVLFKTHKGELFKFKSDNCGWHMNVDTTVERFKEAVGEGKTQFDPAWNSGMVYSEENGVGTKYVEVDIDEQKVYLYENGELVFTTDCVTGQPDGFNDTTCGVYQVIYKASPSVLKGEDAALYSAVAKRLCADVVDGDLLLPSLAVYGSYDAGNGAKSYVCGLLRFYYYGLDINNADNLPESQVGASGSIARITVKDGVCTEIAETEDGATASGRAERIRELCGSLSDLAKSLNDETAQSRKITPDTYQALLSAYAKQ